MKSKRRFWIGAGVVALALTAMAGMAHAGQERDGGDPDIARREDLRQYIQQGLALDLYTFVADLEGLRHDNRVRGQMYDMYDRGILDDIRLAPYRYEPGTRCYKTVGGKKVRVPSSSVNGDLRGGICFDVDLLEERKTTRRELLGLAFHEHAHHFGYKDADHLLMNFAINHPRLAEKGLRSFPAGVYQGVRFKKNDRVLELRPGDRMPLLCVSRYASFMVKSVDGPDDTLVGTLYVEPLGLCRQASYRAEGDELRVFALELVADSVREDPDSYPRYPSEFVR